MTRRIAALAGLTVQVGLVPIALAQQVPAQTSAPAGAPNASETPADDRAMKPASTPGAATTSEMDAAADAAAEIAAMNANAGQPPAPEPEINLADLGMQELEKVTEYPLEIYGFASFTYLNVVSSDKQAINQFIAKEGSFYIGDVNVYLSKQIADQWRTLLEVRLTYAPNGRVLSDGTIEANQSYDQGNFGRPVNWGGINLERAWVEYDIHPKLTIQAGAFLTPYGIWNVDHGMPTIIPITKPYVLNEQIFPERQAGIQLYGKHAMSDYVLGYHATISNGRGYFDQFRDLDETKAFGARLQLQTPWLGSLRIGTSIYQGRFVDRESDALKPNPASGKVENTTPKGVRYKELAYGVDLLQEWRGLRVQAELIGHSLHYLDDARQADGPGFRPDTYALGGYVLAGYRFDRFWNIMPFGFYQRYHRDETVQSAIFSALESYQIGLNFRPVPTLVLKVQWGQAWIPGAKKPVEGNVLNTLSAQVAWVF